MLAFAQADAGATGVLTRAPTLVKQVEAVFPPELLDAGTGGTVVMEVDIGPDGAVLDARVVISAGAAFDASALAAVRQFGFTAAEVDGKPTAVRINYSYEFFFRPQVVETLLSPDAGPQVNFTGRIVERGTRNPVAGAQVVVGEGEHALDTVSADDGTFTLTDVAPGEARVTVASSDYNTYVVQETFTAGKRTEATYFIRKKVLGAFETVVRTTKERKEVAQVTLKQEEIRLIPGTAGDAFRVVQNLPGVARAPFGIGLLVVRGGKTWDTKTFVDEANVPLLFHFGGLFSTFNANLLQDLTFQAGNFNANYGRAIGGLVTAEARTPSKQGLHGYVDVNVVDASALIEAPLSENWSFAVSGRRSYIDVLLPSVLNLIPGANNAIRFTLAPRYFDYQARLEWRPKKSRTRFFITVFGSSDELIATLPDPALVDPEGRADFGTSIAYHRLLVGLELPVTERVDFRTRTSFGFDTLGFTLGKDLYAKSLEYPMLSRNTFTVALPEVRSTLSAGLDFQVLPYSVDVQGALLPKLNEVPDPFLSHQLISEHTFVWQVEPAVFADAVIKPIDSLKLIPGARGDYNSQMNKAWFDPRLSVLWQVADRVLLKGGIGLYHQPPDYRSGALSKVFGNPNLKPEGARQYMVGAEVQFTDAITLDVQGYYKDLFDQVRSTLGDTSGSSTGSSPTDVRYTNIGHGRSYGLEVLLRHALTKNFFGWVSYSLSRTERDFYGGTQWGLSPFDQPHNLVVLASYKLPYDFIVGAKLRYTSGPLDQPVIGTLYDANANYYFPIQDTTYSRRLPDFFQVDVRIDKRFVFQDWVLAIYLDVQNATYHKNVESVLYSYDYSQQAYLTGLPILPVLGVRGEW
jgi:TonB family protein